MQTEAIKRRLIALEAKHSERVFTLRYYEMPGGSKKVARTAEEGKAIETQGGTLNGFDIHIPDKHAEGGYRHIIWDAEE